MRSIRVADLDTVQLGRYAGSDWYTGQRRLMMCRDTTVIKRTLAAVGIGAALSTAQLVVAPASPASPAGFLAEMHSGGFWNTGGDLGMLQMGYWVCTQLDSGWTPAAAVAAISAGNYFGDGSAGTFAALATFELCPFHVGQDFYESRPAYGSSLAA